MKTEREFLSISEIITYFQEIGTAKHQHNLKKRGIPAETILGVPMILIKRVAKKIGINQNLALELWTTKFYETQLLAVLIADPIQTTSELLEKWLNEVNSRELCDHLSHYLIAKVESSKFYLIKWARDSREFFRRAAFNIITIRVLYHYYTADELDLFLDLIWECSFDSRVYVKKSVSFALREIGRIGVAERDRAVALASELVADGTKTQRWIGKNALKELENMKYDKELSRDFNGLITKELIAVK